MDGARADRCYSRLSRCCRRLLLVWVTCVLYCRRTPTLSGHEQNADTESAPPWPRAQPSVAHARRRADEGLRASGGAVHPAEGGFTPSGAADQRRIVRRAGPRRRWGHGDVGAGDPAQQKLRQRGHEDAAARRRRSRWRGARGQSGAPEVRRLGEAKSGQQLQRQRTRSRHLHPERVRDAPKDGGAVGKGRGRRRSGAPRQPWEFARAAGPSRVRADAADHADSHADASALPVERLESR
mmetsp:Transcript_32976/g.92672  ORF Transcript_32976/g.92672 Transcript_32976/m.92672 type:complete len:239 (+) Transcript_32976:1536-2252(+)